MMSILENILNKWLLAGALCASATATFAQEKEEKKAPDNFVGSIDFGYGSTSGNTETESFSLRSKARLTSGAFVNEAELQAVSASQNGVTNKERYYAAYQLNRDLSELVSSFIRADYDNDRFSGFEYQYLTAAGAAITWMVPENHRLKTDLGLGYRYSELQPDAVTMEEANQEETIVRFALDYEWQFSDTARFTQKITSDKGRENTISRSDTELRLTIAEPVSLVVGQHYKFYSDPLPGTQSTDRETKVAVSYSF